MHNCSLTGALSWILSNWMFTSLSHIWHATEAPNGMSVNQRAYEYGKITDGTRGLFVTCD